MTVVVTEKLYVYISFRNCNAVNNPVLGQQVEFSYSAKTWYNAYVPILYEVVLCTVPVK